MTEWTDAEIKAYLLERWSLMSLDVRPVDRIEALESLDAAEAAETSEAVATAWEVELDRREAEFATDAGFGVPAPAVFQRLDAKLAALQAPLETPR